MRCVMQRAAKKERNGGNRDGGAERRNLIGKLGDQQKRITLKEKQQRSQKVYGPSGSRYSKKIGDPTIMQQI